MRRKRVSQSLMEYAVLLAIVALAVAAMRTYVMSSVQAHMKVLQEQLNRPQDANE